MSNFKTLNRWFVLVAFFAVLGLASLLSSNIALAKINAPTLADAALADDVTVIAGTLAPEDVKASNVTVTDLTELNTELDKYGLRINLSIEENPDSPNVLNCDGGKYFCRGCNVLVHGKIVSGARPCGRGSCIAGEPCNASADGEIE